MKTRFLWVCLLCLSAMLGCGESPDPLDAERTSIQETSTSSIKVVDYSGRAVRLDAPANRIVALSPHIVENLFTAGAGEKIVAVVDHSDYPESASRLPSLGSFNHVSVEAIIAVQPDLVVGWASGSKDFAKLLQKLESSGIAVYVDEPRKLEDISRSLLDFGRLAGTLLKAEEQVSKFNSDLSTLRSQFQGRKTVDVFYQIWNQPLQTLNGEHIISDILSACGARNIFSDVGVLAPTVNIESILKFDPPTIIASIASDANQFWLQEWQQWPQLRAVQREHLYAVPAEWLSRQTVRMMLGAQLMCKHIEQVRIDL